MSSRHDTEGSGEFDLDLRPFRRAPLGMDNDEAVLLDRAANELEKWARRLAAVAEHVPSQAYAHILPLMGERRPYIFERNTSRWPDGLYHLVDRGYHPYGNIAFSLDQLRELGVVAWGESEFSDVGFADGCAPLMDDLFDRKATQEGLMRLARLLVAIVKAAIR